MVTKQSLDFTCTPLGPFNLLHQNQYFNGWPTLKANGHVIVMSFPVEGWNSSAAVTLQHLENGDIKGTIYGAVDTHQAKLQALAALSLDEDGSGWPSIGEQDEFVGRLQKTYEYMRPTLFHSAYEAAAAFTIGHRISIAQARKIREHLAEVLGDSIAVGKQVMHAFPLPEVLLKMESFRGLSDTKIKRLHAIAQATLDGILDRKYLRGINEEEALTKLESLPGIGPFFSQGILYRGVGVTDGFTHDDFTYYAIQQAYKLAGPVTKEQVLRVAEMWRPYRMWVTVLLHVWLRESGNLPKRTFSKR